MRTKDFVILKALECLLRISMSTRQTELDKARNKYIESTIKMIKELLYEHR